MEGAARTRRGIGRRALLQGMGGGAGLVLSAGPLASALLACARSAPLAAGLAGFFSLPGAAAAVGEALLDARAFERDPAALVDAIAGRERAEWDAMARDAAALAHALRRSHREDFAQGRVVALRGWVLSRTEAALCALVALEAEAPRG